MDIRIHQKASRLALFTVVYNVIEGIVCIVGGTALGSISLVAFGLDSFIESLSSSILIWRFKHHDDSSEDAEMKREHKATKLIGYTFFILGTYVLYEAIKNLYYRQAPEHSIFGIIVALASILIMTFVWRAKYNIGKEASSKSLIADSKQTLACIIMSVVLLISIGLNNFFSIWWADAVGGIIITLFLFKEGYEALEEEKE